TFREILNDRDKQVAFVELNPRPQVLPGQVVRLNLQPANLRPDPRGKVSDARKAAEEARQLGKWLQDTGLAKLRAETWRDVAVFSQGYGDRFQIETLTTGKDLVSKTLSLLAQLRLSILPLPLFDAINEIVGRTQLRERLNALPQDDFENLDGELDALLALAGSSEAEG